MPTDSVYARLDAAVATITLSRPAGRNALTVDMWERLSPLIEQMDRDTAVRVVVVTGEGESFAQGTDMAEVERAFHDMAFGIRMADAVQEAERRLMRNIKPTIAKIRGVCSGGGIGIALSCDLRFADSTASFTLPLTKLGMVYSLADTKRLMDKVGMSRAKDLLYTGRALSAEEALACGLIDFLVPPAGLDRAVADYAADVASMSQYSTRATKRIVQMILDGATEDTRDSRRLYIDAFSGADFREGVAAFIEKRKPNFPVT
jgi:enoyl-CoA hydratase/carnithine racemase